MRYNPFARMQRSEWILWLFSLSIILFFNLLAGLDVLMLCATMIGATGLVLLARGDLWGQVTTAAFAVLYAMISYRFRYWGEMFTYAGMTLPMAIVALVSWLRNPYAEGEVAINKLKKSQIFLAFPLTAGVTLVFFFILHYLQTPNLLPSTLSVTASFLAVYLTAMRSSAYALAYASNDVILIVLWGLATREDRGYLPILATFSIFLVNDLYGFCSWKKREKLQRLQEIAED